MCLRSSGWRRIWFWVRITYAKNLQIENKYMELPLGTEGKKSKSEFITKILGKLIGMCLTCVMIGFSYEQEERLPMIFSHYIRRQLHITNKIYLLPKVHIIFIDFVFNFHGEFFFFCMMQLLCWWLIASEFLKFNYEIFISEINRTPKLSKRVLFYNLYHTLIFSTFFFFFQISFLNLTEKPCSRKVMRVKFLFFNKSSFYCFLRWWWANSILCGLKSNTYIFEDFFLVWSRIYM